ncbi:dihydrofolate reductase [Nonlabens ponticola]|uniref:dihydrofolate reductase n=1 Tax=Nonlabens ponticola TaxID=2496866 RepID=A0A3S9MUS3_9FLAO|nr:dihydrofolate reductase [Nonlabens ponticola]AZQ42929.1 dihydrofolate reductase [Nonlabens ponticola]
MFSNKKKQTPGIDPDQKEMIDNARLRIKQKRGLFSHFIVFLVGSVGLIVVSQFFIKSEIPQLLGIDWWIWIIFAWALILLYHLFKVYVTQKLLGPDWEKRQYDKLVSKQQDRINKLQGKVEKDYPLPDAKVVITPTKNYREVTMIAAAGNDDGLGKDGQLVWHLPDDFKRFKRLTTGHHIIMGRKTFDSFDKPLPNRTHIVLTRDKSYTSDHAIICHDMDTALAAASDDPQPFIIGGGEIYKLGLPYADKIELTRVHGSFTTDAHFPEIDESKWKLVNSLHHPADDKHKYSFDYETWVRK